jgi:DNA polymerase-3 subunit epsilon
MTGGQSTFALDVNAAQGAVRAESLAGADALRDAAVQLPVMAATADELLQHEALLDLIQKASGGKVLWRPVPGPDGDGTHKNH